ncbi:hypothetical protein SERLADRAFT_349289 [Serpula lacrymans var. lacrymans S7.9]|nr:uncharacterized protein SERLADRAFT_349289 [Serpula lacrymans var. lacrymans S7.9]EGO24791.1 hypothetical protein SERLADRAFT_349289 [Serpula lacrymans var. lacrymans S7.9]
MPYSTTFVLSAVFAIAFVVILRLKRRNPLGLPYPPGPRLLPFVGNAFDINPTEPYLTYADWGRQYGGIVYSSLLGQDFIIINSEKVARELVDQRSTNYSDRPIIATNKLFGMDFNTGLLPYGDEWRLHRKLFHRSFRSEAAATYHELHLRKAHQLVLDLLNEPFEVERHVKIFSASVILAATYGYEVKPHNDPVVVALEELVDILAQVMSPEQAALLTAFPFLEHFPAWFPGASFKRSAPHCQDLVVQVKDVPFDFTKKNVVDGTAATSMVSFLLSQGGGDESSGHEQSIRDAAATVFIAGFETTFSTLHTFVLAMLLHPEVQARAQAEIDSVTGGTRFPEFEDRTFLPYVDAVFRETMRWHVVAPLSLPHATTESDTYNGYFIPKGAIVVTNIWAMSQDENRYEDPKLFLPERHLTKDGKLVDEPITGTPPFGFGRRICPGRFVAEDSVWVAIVSVLAALRIANARDSEGREIPATESFTTGVAV